MTIAACKIVAGIPSGRIRYLRPDVSIGGRDQIPAAPHQPTMIIIRQRANLRDGPIGRLVVRASCATLGDPGKSVARPVIVRKANAGAYHVLRPGATQVPYRDEESAPAVVREEPNQSIPTPPLIGSASIATRAVF